MTDAGALPVDQLVPPARTEARGSEEGDGHDNQHLPRFELTPLPQPALPPVPADALLVPWIVHYYSHNGGWFQGQTWGTGAGARIRVLWSLHDADGAVLGHGDHQAWYTDEDLFSPNSVQVEDHLMEVEDALCRDLRRHILR